MKLLHSQIHFGDLSGDVEVEILFIENGNVYYDLRGTITSSTYDSCHVNKWLPHGYINTNKLEEVNSHFHYTINNENIFVLYSFKIETSEYYVSDDFKIYFKHYCIKTVFSDNLDFIDEL